MIRIGMADDEPLFLAGLAMLLDAQEDMEVSWRAGNGKEALDLAARSSVDVLLLDVQMPLCDGLEATRRFVSRGLSGRIVILTTFDTEGYVLGAIEAGASGFLLKNTPPQSLIDAIRTLASGDSVISPGPTRRLIRAMRETTAPSRTSRERAPSEPVSAELTEREVEVLALIAQGLTNQEMCDRLWVSMPTIKTHVSHLLVKTGARDRVQLVLYALRTGVADLDSVLAQGH
ncbi:two component system response regulator [Schaalia cardiffensis F0333]|uniref:Two component system response regulator n=1 Tax=Schaalia cardiffensis F0333 TaxID=888050 RepID=N6X6C6_9ACTO|nr:response regulator transcription factor [Schaalia cardiffensis]ENO18932.1 two component system response regulator [Schaalia cardiffensis F0333]